MAQQYERSEVRRRQIADAALVVIAEQGLGRFTTRAIGSHVGISEGTIFRHFQSKEEIVLAAIARLEETMSSHWSDHADPVVRLEQFFRARAAFVGQQRSVGRLLLSDHLDHAAGETGCEEVRRWRRRNWNWVLACMTELKDRGLLHAGLSPQQATRLLQGLISTFVIDGALDLRRAIPLDQQVNDAWTSLCVTLFR